MPNIDIPENIEHLNLSQATQYVIDQNTSVGYPPTEFIKIVNRGIASGDLDVRISNLVADIALLERLESVIKNHPGAVMIEDLIANKSDGFGLSDEVKRQAQARMERFNQLRFNT